MPPGLAPNAKRALLPACVALSRQDAPILPSASVPYRLAVFFFGPGLFDFVLGSLALELPPACGAVLGAVFSWITCRIRSRFLSIWTLACAMPFWLRLMASARIE